MKSKVVLFTIAFTIFSCQKEEDIGCKTIKLSDNGFVDSDITYRKPSFNPLNSSELIFVYNDTKQGKSQLVKQNWKTKQSTVLVESFIDNINSGSVAWGNDGWIAFLDHEKGFEEVVIVRSDGTGMQNLGMQAKDLTYAPDGTLYAAMISSSHSIYFFTLDIATKNVDTVAHLSSSFPGAMSFTVSQYLTLTFSKVFDISLVKGEQVDIGEYMQGGHGGFDFFGIFAYSEDGGSVYISRGRKAPGGLVRMPRNYFGFPFMEIEIEECASVRYGYMDFSADNRYLAIEKCSLTNNEGGVIEMDSKILIIDLVTKKEHIVEL